MNRRKLLAQIHIGKKDLNIDDSAYRALLQRIIGTDSCGKAGNHQLIAVIREMRRLGWRPKAPKYGRKPKANQANAAMINKVAAILADNRWHWNYAHSTAKKMFGIDFVHWLKPAQLHKLIAALQIHADRLKRQGPDDAS